jgi:uncharacterized protein DUF5916
MPLMRGANAKWLVAALVLLPAVPATGQSALSGEPLHINRTSGTIRIDGRLDDDGWRDAARVETWYETNPGDNIEPSVGNLALLAYDDRFLYAGFEFADPDPSSIRAPLGDRDNVPGFTDYGGVILDTRHDGHSAMMMLCNARGIQYDAITDDSSGEDSSPDFFWDCVARITDKGWTLEIRVPFSSLRYRSTNPQTWGILLYRNRPRDFRYQIFSARLPRGGNCFVCRSNPLLGLSRLPEGGHIVIAPYFNASDAAVPIGSLGTELARQPVNPEFGLDLKWAPDADNVVDATVNPDFSQVESDTAQISANERFALFYPEKRPFFLEGVDLFATPIQAVYTRTITAPSWGGRATGKAGGVRYTALVAEDDGGGTVIVPGPINSEFAVQMFKSTVLVARAKRDIGLSYLSVLATDREGHDGGGYNRVAGPDFQWRPSGSDNVKGQWLWSSTKTPDRPDLTPSWTGETLASHAAHLEWSHNTEHLDWFTFYKDFGDEFRADTGFVPQVGYRHLLGHGGWTFRPTNFLSRLRTFATVDRQNDLNGALITREIEIGAGMDTKLNGFMQYRFLDDRTRLGAPGDTERAQRVAYIVRISPSRVFAQLSADGRVGEEFDFANNRLGHGAIVNLLARVDPTKNLELEMVQNQQLLSVQGQRLFTARVSRVRGVYTFTPRSFIRAIAQYVSTKRDPALYLETVDAESGFMASSILFAYKLNWQSVLFVGYGDDRELSDLSKLEKSSRQAFVKVSYAFQR